ncbi:putative transcription initiation factor II protein 55 [Chloropicon primus]|uniref:Putative transcription initiation factor II protein 55 n=1 Tax=Chloropicon primus TaxID=1764295 RepID=A0A5B8MH01_9CHLO|nr:putative transcription initiation factor II protein 55 [Chloropicon primus]UPQ98915.1 putative transcription initiation factor II protein 55 [Chloropicon primus]|eukprot:QDZ19703.1 putative transcription initiation factor II protein 55 [Chloropicon primus]
MSGKGKAKKQGTEAKKLQAARTGAPTEEAYLLRVQNPKLAEDMKRMLRNQHEVPNKMEMRFKSDREGAFILGEKTFQASVRNLPCVTEVFKTLDDENLVKTVDVGQVVLVRDEEGEAPQQGEWRDGVTPVMRDARTRHFRKLPEMDPGLVEKVETELVEIVNHGAPKGWTYEDVEEEYVEGKDGKEGYWKEISRNQY